MIDEQNRIIIFLADYGYCTTRLSDTHQTQPECHYPGKTDRYLKGGTGHLEGRIHYLAEHFRITEEKNLVESRDCSKEKKANPDYVQQDFTLFIRVIYCEVH